MTNADAVTRLNAALEGRYKIERELGEGGMATVYLADDIKHQRKVALKVLKPELAATIGPDRFLQEVRVTANLQHPHILPLFDSGEADGFLFYVMPFLDGESVRERLAREGELPVTEALMILREVVDALSAAHGLGVVHRDIKPDNVMLTGRHAVVTDFGVAKAVSEGANQRNLPTAGVALGTPIYMAPEQAANDPVDHRADIYAVGAMGYELLAGRPPFSGRPVQQILLAHITEPPRDVAQLRPSVPAGVASLIMRCLEKKAADRWQTADELLAQFDTLAPQTAGATPAHTPLVRTGPGVPMWLKVAAPASLIVLAGAAWFGGFGRVGERGETESSISSSAGIDEIMSHERLIVMPLVNLTGEPEDDVWSMLAAEWIGKAIDRPRPIDVIPAAAVRDALNVLGDSGSVSAVANRVAASHAIAGTLARTGDQVRFQIELMDVRTGELLRTLDPAVGSVDSVEATVGRLADNAAVAAVVVLSPSTSILSPIRSMPPSIDAYRQVVLTGDMFCQGRYREAIEAGDRARELAPDLVSPLFLVRIAYVQLGLVEESDSVTALLQTMRDRMTNVERLIQEHRINSLAGDLDMVTRTGEELFRMMPTTVLGGFQAGQIAVRRRRTTEAVDRFLMVDTDAPCAREWRPLWSSLADAYHLLGRYEEELSLVRRGLARFPEARPLMDREARALAAMDQEGRVDSLLVAMDELPPQSRHDQNFSAVLAGLELRAHGHHEAARRTLETAADRYATLPPGQYRQNRGRAYQHAGRWEEADTTFTALAAEEPESWALIADHGLILATMGRVADAKVLSRRLAEFDVHPSRRGEVIGRRVAIAAALGEQEDAIALLQEAFAAGYMYGTQFHTDPAYVAMRDNPQWAALVAPG